MFSFAFSCYSVASCLVYIAIDSIKRLQPKEEISEKPVVDNSKVHEYITGVFRNEDRLILMLDIARALSVEDRSALSKQHSAKAA